jgi:hypothetical protein
MGEKVALRLRRNARGAVPELPGVPESPEMNEHVKWG